MPQNQPPFTYIINNKFYSYLRNQINTTYVSQDQLKQIVGEDAIVLRSQSQEALLQFTYCPILIVVYGQITIDEKVYGKGQFFQCSIQIVKMSYRKSSMVLVLCAELIHERIEKMNEILKKIKIINHMLPTIKMKLIKSQIIQLARNMQIIQLPIKFTKLELNKGIYIFIQGIFQILYQGIIVMELQHGFFQIEDILKNVIRSKQMRTKYGFITQEKLTQILSEQSLEYLQKISKQRQQWNSKCNLYPKSNFKEVKRKIKSKKNIAISLKKSTQNIKTLTKTFSVKQYKNAFSTEISLEKSLSIEYDKRGKHKLRKNQTEVDEECHVVFEKKYDKPFYDSHTKLDKLRRYEKLKNKSRNYDEHWLHLDDLRKGVNMGYTQIKQMYTKQHQTSMTNFKRIFNTHKNSPMKKVAQTFR